MLFMKKSIFSLISVAILVELFSSCANPRWFWCSSEGIMTYNRATGQFEVLWTNKTQPTESRKDTVYIVQESHNSTEGVR